MCYVHDMHGIRNSWNLEKATGFGRKWTDVATFGRIKPASLLQSWSKRNAHSLGCCLAEVILSPLWQMMVPLKTRVQGDWNNNMISKMMAHNHILIGHLAVTLLIRRCSQKKKGCAMEELVYSLPSSSPRITPCDNQSGMGENGIEEHMQKDYLAVIN